MVDKQSPVEIPSACHVTEAERKTRQPRTTVRQGESCCRWLVGHDDIGYMAVEIKSTQTVFGEKAGDHYDAQHHCEQEIEQIVAGVDGCDPDAKREQQEARAFRGQ